MFVPAEGDTANTTIIVFEAECFCVTGKIPVHLKETVQPHQLVFKGIRIGSKLDDVCAYLGIVTLDPAFYPSKPSSNFGFGFVGVIENPTIVRDVADFETTNPIHNVTDGNVCLGLSGENLEVIRLIHNQKFNSCIFQMRSKLFKVFLDFSIGSLLLGSIKVKVTDHYLLS